MWICFVSARPRGVCLNLVNREIASVLVAVLLWSRVAARSFFFQRSTKIGEINPTDGLDYGGMFPLCALRVRDLLSAHLELSIDMLHVEILLERCVPGSTAWQVHGMCS